MLFQVGLIAFFIAVCHWFVVRESEIPSAKLPNAGESHAAPGAPEPHGLCADKQWALLFLVASDRDMEANLPWALI